MKKYLLIFILFISLTFLYSCAKPTVVNIVLPNDKNLNCSELEDEYKETRRFRKEAVDIKDVSTGGNMTRTMLFWPALLKTLHNADVAIKAANDRGYHLVKIMKKNNCENADQFYTELTKAENYVRISIEIKRLHKLHKSGALTDEEFTLAKKKVLSQ